MMQKLQQDAFKIFMAGVRAVAPCKLTLEALKVSRDKLFIQDKEYHLNHNVHVVAFGKAVFGMVQAVEKVLGSHIVQGVASVPIGTQNTISSTNYQPFRQTTESSCSSNGNKIEIIEGAKDNFPDENAQRAAIKIMKIAESVKENDILLVLVSGGGSALLPLPVSEILLEEKNQTTRILSKKGASIVELNTVRKHLSRIKGGKLAQAAYPASVITLILSDVLGDPMDIIACGPTVPDTSTKRDCLEIVDRLNARLDLPVNVIKYLSSEFDLRNTVELDFSHVNNIIIGNNTVAVDGASWMAKKLGYDVIIHDISVSGESRDVGEFYARLISCEGEKQLSGGIKEIGASEKALCILGAGETTVSVHGNGRGGRNQELALAAAIEMNKFSMKRNYLLLSAGTDGQDGPTSAAGAYAFPNMITMATAQGLNAMMYLKNNDSFSFYTQFENGEYLVNTGLTGTNVMDLHVLLSS
ncbi:glycerate kinase-like isoform X2 [Dendronephthya gigantea]|uniref:glycerate kinase-like isoform X2 n=1 Tax=Dendronephthya gigantea TaxID=151771 RepID=UPI00106CEDAB|nr:glycerate kinase-like isoform X2 [Dendronephthya gigantea]